MSNSKYRYRRGARRLTGVLAATAVVGAGAVATTGVAYAEEDESTLQTVLETFDPADFAAKAAELPAGLQKAIERDLGISAADYLANAEATKVAAEVSANLKADGVGIEGTAIDGQAVTIYVSSEADVAAAEATGAANVEVGKPEAKDYSDYDFQPAEDLRGGYGYTGYGSDDYLWRCSVGFNGYDAGGNDRLLTAGHCAFDGNDEEMSDVDHIDVDGPIWDDESWVEQIGEPIGAFVPGASQFGDNHDAGLVDVTGSNWDNVPQVSEWGDGEGDPTDGAVTIYDSVDAVEGAQACKSGATSGWKCGEITETETTIDVDGRDVDGFTFTACLLGGDSGGSIIVGNYALGVNSASTHGGRTECDSWDGGGSDFSLGYAVSGGTNNAFDFYGDEWELNVEVNTPVVENATATESGATLSGTVENAGANHRVLVSIEGVGDYEADVNADGEFTVEVDETLEAGAEYSYTATAYYGQYSESEQAAGTFTVEEEPEVAELQVESPSDGQTTGNTRPPFNGTGEPGAEVVLSIGDNEYGSATVGDDGSWTIEPDSDLPVGQRFDATVTQTAGEDVQEATVSDLGIEADDVTITVPEDGAEVTGDVVFEGTSFAGATVSLQIEGTIESSNDAESASEFSAAAGEVAPAQEDEPGNWPGEFEIDDQGNWTFDPDEDLENGEYTLTAMATMEDGDPELTDSEASVDFTVQNDEGGDEDGGDENGGDENGDEDGGDENGGDEEGDDLPDTGSSSMPMILIGVGLLAAGGGAVALRARRNAASNA
ncbi:Ig-like domain-containing protein [Phytoactinopolyspora halotolerans]|uniref:LPXTG cell wall anchor domain-containing protein n=1 Tax=Phytoactinopolyspora halotolerans TaxID=1981512 RepID=A0A6L9SBM7_9ACTN|nr:Ig-like domain-containing protein [Phytoactinopolyspora halotolerans]NEE02527.1 LPXTG cell wall anchor domain-containing protein [Phytoactinopolyspora halotolerans]